MLSDKTAFKGANTRAKGSEGESLAEKYLKNKNFKIIKRNFHFGRYGEIDIVARDNETLVFVEVKSRKSKEFGDPLESITYKKQKAIRRTAEGYLYVNNIYDKECRFDVITIDYSEDVPKINHLINAF